MIILSYKDTLGYGENVFFHMLSLLGFYIMFYQLWVTLLYLLVFIIIYIFKFQDKNIFFGMGMVDVGIRAYDFFITKHRNSLTLNDWILFFPAFVLILIGIIYWLWKRNGGRVRLQ